MLAYIKKLKRNERRLNHYNRYSLLSKFQFIIFLLAGVILNTACSKVEIVNLSVTKRSHDLAVAYFTFKKGSKTVFPDREDITILVPSEESVYSVTKPILALDGFSLPDKDVGSEVTMYVKVCGLFGKVWVCDSIMVQSSRKYLSAKSIVQFDDLDKPLIEIAPLLYRDKFARHSLNEAKQERFVPDEPMRGLFIANLNQSSESIYLYGVQASTLGYWKFDDKDFKSLRDQLKSQYMYDNDLSIEYYSSFKWRNLSYSTPRETEVIQRPDIIELQDNYYHSPNLGDLSANYYSFYNYGTKLGVVTYKEFSNTENLRVELYADRDFTQLITSSNESNVLFDKYSNQYIYIKVLNTSNFFYGDYELTTHMVDYLAIRNRAMGNRALAEIIAWLTDSDANDVARFMDVFNSIMNNESLETATRNFLYSEFKRQLSHAAGGTFVTDVGADALTDIGKEIYKYY